MSTSLLHYTIRRTDFRDRSSPVKGSELLINAEKTSQGLLLGCITLVLCCQIVIRYMSWYDQNLPLGYPYMNVVNSKGEHSEDSYVRMTLTSL